MAHRLTRDSVARRLARDSVDLRDLPRWLVVAGACLLGLSLVDDQVILWADGAPDPLRPAQAVAQFAAVGCLVALALRRTGVGAALLGVALLAALAGRSPVPGLASLAVAGFAYALRHQSRALAVAGAAGAAWLAATAYALPATRTVLLWQATPSLIVLVATAWLLGRSRARRLAAERRASDLAAAADEARRAERRLLARELHDVVAHGLTLITLQAGVMAATDDAERRDRAGATIESTARSALGELHTLLGVLRSSDAVAEPEGTAEGVHDLAALIAEQADECERLGHPMVAAVELGPGALPPGVALAGDRIVRECVANTLKHAAPGEWWLSADLDGGDLVIAAESPLATRPLPAVPSTSLGLTGLAERVRLLGGTMTAGPRCDTWLVEVRIPVREN
ncbi:sensor histidine kinase [Mariniluteicoccus flavus]